jgi:hypothetical protein
MKTVFAAALCAANSLGCASLLAQEPASASELAPPVRLEADGKPIDIGTLSKYAHAGPTRADVDGDGDQDLLVGDFPGYFWFFENTGSDAQPRYTSRGKLHAGNAEAKTPVY